jgi:SusD family.
MKSMINKTILLLSSILFLFLGACSDVLDQAPDGKTSLDEVFTDNFKTAAYLNSCYYRIPDYGMDYWFSTRGPVVVSDEAWDNDDTEYPYGVSIPMYNGNASASTFPMIDNVGSQNVKNGKYYDRFFECIRNCATFIQRIDNATVNNETDRRRWKAEAHLLRAFYYSELLKWYGTGVPIIREPYEYDDDFSGVVKPSYQEVVEFILEDCDFALNTPELPWRITSSSERSRLTKATAEAIKSRVILYAASPLYNEGEDIWERAYQINKTSLQNLRDNGYELYTKVNFPDIYANDEDKPDNEAHLPNKTAALMNEYFTQDYDYATNPVDKETIYSYWSSSMDASYFVEGIGCQGTYKAGTVPSQEMVDAYETIDGEPVLDLKKPYLDEKHTNPNYNPDNTMYDENDPYKNRDPRFYSSIYYNGSKRTCKWASTETPECLDNYNQSPNGNGPVYRTRVISTWVGEPLTGIHDASRTRTRTGYYIRKFLRPNAGDTHPANAPVEKIFRLGEVILNCAESAAEANHLQEAYELVNEIRTRAGMPPLPNSLTTDKEKLILRIRHERRVEMALEGHRYFDVRRWQNPDGDLSATDKWITAMEITRETKGDGSFSHYTYKRRPVRPAERLCYTNKYLKAPIPKAEAAKMLGITGVNWQNPGW